MALDLMQTSPVMHRVMNMALSGAGSLMIIDDVVEDRSRQIISAA